MLAAAVITVSVIASGIMAPGFVGSAAADESAPKAAVATPISLAGRWSGQHLGYGRAGESGACASDTGCTLTYDFVACKEGWCGIAIKDDKTCGPVGVRLAVNSGTKVGGSAFKGQLVIAKGSAPYAVEAWYRDEGGTAKLLLIGDTGPELRIMRRSFPFEADLSRAGDATCTIDKATS